MRNYSFIDKKSFKIIELYEFYWYNLDYIPIPRDQT